MIRNAFGTLATALFKPIKTKIQPPLLQLEPTDYCNLRCQTCQREYLRREGKKMDSRHMKLGKFKNIIDQVAPHNIEITGLGEPLLNPDFIDMISCAKEKGMVISAFSNFTLVNRNVAEAIVKSGLDLIRVSLDACSSEVYRKVRKSDLFEKVVSGISALINAKKELNAKSPFIRACFVIQKDNLAQMKDFVRFCNKMEVDGVYFQLLDITSMEEDKDRLWGDTSCMEVLLKLREALEESLRIKMNTNLSSLIRDGLPFWDKLIRDEPEMRRQVCLFPWFAPYITVYGMVKVCCIAAPSEAGEVNMGNIFKEGFQEIWNNSKYHAFRKLIKEGRVPEICKYCVPRTLPALLRRADFLTYLRGAKRKRSWP